MLLSPSHYRTAATESLAAANRPGRVILLHTGAMLLLSLLLTLADHFLDLQIASTGGLRDMDSRTMLTTARSVLFLAELVLLPFWQIGYTYYTLRVARGQSAGATDLLEGFRRFGPVLRLKLLQLALLILLAIVSSYAASMLFVMTPWSAPLVTEMENMMSSGLNEAELTAAILSTSRSSLIPMMVIFGLCFLAGGVFLYFRFRQAELWLMDHPGSGALAALLYSRRCMRGNWWGMFRIDLSFWWFFLLEAIVSALCFGDEILDIWGIQMTTDTFLSYLLFFCLYLLTQLGLYWWKRNDVAVTYAHAYLALCPEDAAEETPVNV